MLKYITISILIFTTVIVKAQTKPTKQETVDFINRICESVVGRSSGTFSSVYSILQGSFTLSKVNLTENDSYFKDNCYYEYSNMKWESLDTTKHASVETHIDGVIALRVYFIIKCKTVIDCDVLNVHTSEFTDYIDITIPEEKETSIWKACLRLSEIAREENTDPFQD